MDYQHYIGRGPEAQALIAKVRAGHKAFLLNCQIFRDVYGATGLITKGTYGRVIGLGLKEPLSDEEARKRGLKAAGRTGTAYIYKAHKGTKLGKTLLAEIKKLNEGHVDPSKALIKATGMDRMTYSAGVLASSVAGFSPDALVVKVPLGGTDPMPTPPAWLVPCKESEALAAMGK